MTAVYLYSYHGRGFDRERVFGIASNTLVRSSQSLSRAEFSRPSPVCRVRPRRPPRESTARHGAERGVAGRDAAAVHSDRGPSGALGAGPRRPSAGETACRSAKTAAAPGLRRRRHHPTVPETQAHEEAGQTEPAAQMQAHHKNRNCRRLSCSKSIGFNRSARSPPEWH